MNSVQALLRNKWAPEKLLTKYSVDFHRGKIHQNLVAFKATPDAIDASRLVQEANGVVLDEANNWEVVALPFDKFFRHGHVHAASLDWSSAVAEEWLDGVLCMLYFYDGDWHVATRNSPDASVQVSSYSGKLVRDLFWEVWKEEKFQLPDVNLKYLTFLFELTASSTAKVVEHKQRHLTCVGVRHVKGAEIKPDWQDYYPSPLAVPLERKTIGEVHEILQKYNPRESRGLVVRDKFWHRVIVNHPAYDVMAKSAWAKTPLRTLAALVVTGGSDGDDLSPYFPERRNVVVTLSEKVKLLSYQIDAAFFFHKPEEGKREDKAVRKEFAAKVKDLPYSGVLFQLYDKRIKSAIEGLQLMPVDTLLHLVGYVDEDVVVKDSDAGINDALGG